MRGGLFLFCAITAKKELKANLASPNLFDVWGKGMQGKSSVLKSIQCLPKATR